MPNLLSIAIKLITYFTKQIGPFKYTHINHVFYTDSKNIRQMGEILIPDKEGPNPGVIIVHGGGWSSRSYEDMHFLAQSLASQGFVVFNINYRYSPEFKHPAQVNDLKSALEFFKLNSSKYNLDPNRIGLWGYSAGAHIASYYALVHSDQSSYKVQGVVSGGAPLDLTWYPFSPIIIKYLGKYRDEMLQEYIDASPVTKLTKTAPPFFLYHGIKDSLVEVVQSTSFEAKLKNLNVPVETEYVKWMGHMTTVVMSKKSISNGINFLKKYL